MTPLTRSEAAALGRAACSDPADELDELLAEIPEDAGIAASMLVHVVARIVGGTVTAGWSIGTDRTTVSSDRSVGTIDGAEFRRRVDLAAGTLCAGRVTLLWDAAGSSGDEPTTRLQQAVVWLAMAVERDEAVSGADAAGAETTAVQHLVSRLLSVRDVDQVLLSIADRTLDLLDADICGVFLREGDEVRMRSCVGNRVIETSRLRMRRGQGVAGLVFLTGEPAKVDKYLDDDTISQDFMGLAEREETQSALAVPLRLQGEFLGVLEVWRRRPSIFTDQDVRRMVTLADFATIAIDNAHLHDEQAAAVAAMKQTRDELERQVAVLDRSSHLQQQLLTTVLDGGGLSAIARTVATEIDCQIGIYGPRGELVAAHGGRSLLVEMPESVVAGNRTGRCTIPGDGRDLDVWVRPVYADGDQIGCVYLRPGDQTAEMLSIVTGQAAMACSLALLRQRAASRARSEAMEQVLWDLLQGPLEHRLAARTRAQQLNVPLGGSLRVLYGRLENVEELAVEKGWDTSQTDRVRRDALRTLRATEEGHVLALASLRGDMVVALAPDLDRSSAKDLVSTLTAEVHSRLDGLRLTWGVSRSHEDVVDLPSALNEAKTALSAAYRLGGGDVFLYEELGIVRLLLGSGSDPDLQAFIDDVTGPLLAYDRDNDGSLVRTLRAFFDADCSQRVAAERMYIHHKTLRYRLERIKGLTGLDLSRHDDRMRADFALRLLQISGAGTGDPEAGA